MLRWLLLAAISWGLVVGLQKGWVDVHWDRALHDLGLPFSPAPQRCPPPAG
ncbi:MAG: hypothetical protein ACKN83_01955 [Vulcanococcus sp.]